MKKLLLFCLSILLLTACSEPNSSVETSLASTATPILTVTRTNTPTVVPSATHTPRPQPTMVRSQPDWVNSPHALAEKTVSCDSCHLATDGNLTTKLAMLDQSTGDQIAVSDKSSLCRSCHEGYDHKEDPHESFGCLNCHDPHSTDAACENCHDTSGDTSIIAVATPADGHHNGEDSLCYGAGCHISATQAAETPSTAHPNRHPLVNCSACHDATSAEVGPGQSDPIWITIEHNDAGESVSFTSHTLQKKVDCQRCHFVANPWGLSEHESDESLIQ